MKKIMICVILMIFWVSSSNTISAGEYLTYEDIAFEKRNAKLLRDFSTYDYNRLYSQLSGRRFFGWRTVENLSNEPVSFKKETLYVIVNEGQTPIRQNFTFKQSQQTTRQVSASGSIGLDLSGEIRGFNAGLDSQLNTSITSERSTMIEENVDIHIQVDPMTELRVEIYGEGLISNGVGKQYRFFRNTRSGGWEVFLLQTEYYSIIKEAME